MKRRATLLMLLLLLMCFLPVYADVDDGYTTELYDVSITVSDEDVYHIEETIQVHFLVPSHGIYRTIPLRGTMVRDGQSSKYKARISNIEVADEEFKVTKSGGNAEIRIGDADRYANKDMTYRIAYDYDMQGDRLKDADEFYLNLLGGWTSGVDRFTFTVTMPKNFDPDKVGLMQNDIRISSFESDGTSVMGTVENVYAEDDITLRIVLPEEYFEEADIFSNFDPFETAGSGAALVVAVLAIALSRILGGKKQIIVEPVEFYSPAGLGPEEDAFLYHESNTHEGTMAILLELANEGYLAIHDGDKNEFSFRKLREYDGGNAVHRTFFNGLFSSGDTATVKSLKNRFYQTVEACDSMIKAKHGTKMFEKAIDKRYKTMKYIGYGVFILGFVLNIETFFLESAQLMCFVGMVGLMFLGWISKSSKKEDLVTLLAVVLTIAAIVLLGFDSVGTFGLCFIAACVLCNSSGDIRRYTPEYLSMIGRVRGFRHFLEVAEKDRINALVEEDPKYFYGILPYAYALGVTDKWAKKFEAIAIEPPDWYYGSYHDFNTIWFMNRMNAGMAKTVSAGTSNPDSGGSGGGSFSGGGGAGGGGGGRW